MPTTFRDFMESALYDPERGFYSVREKTADFYTAPELHPAFGAVLADRVALLLRRVRDENPGQRLALVDVLVHGLLHLAAPVRATILLQAKQQLDVVEIRVGRF